MLTITWSPAFKCLSSFNNMFAPSKEIMFTLKSSAHRLTCSRELRFLIVEVLLNWFIPPVTGAYRHH